MPKKRNSKLGIGVALVVAVLASGGLWLTSSARPTSPGPEILVKFDERTPLDEALQQLERKAVVRNAFASMTLARLQRKGAPVAAGVYQVRPGMTLDAILTALRNPVHQMVRLPETKWARRSANLLERANVTKAEDYMALWAKPQDFQIGFPYPLPKNGTLEGYLYPDTYELPPMLGARGVIDRQLRNFERRLKPYVTDKTKLYRALIIASMVELEVAKDEERPIVAGIIENRLKRGMKLEIDACINYALQEWRPLTYADLKNVDSKYNTYKYAGLPPGPICSPTLKSILAALHPAKHNYLYYVAMPEKYHLFSSDFAQHRRNIAKRRAALKAKGL